MRTPKCLQEKAFFILLPILITSIGSASAALYTQIEHNTQYDYAQDERINTLSNQVSQDNVPELKEYLIRKFSEQNTQFDKMEDKIDNIERMTRSNFIILCQLNKGDC